MRVLNFGSLNLDLVYQMDHLIRGGETFAADRLDKFPGGKGLNQSVALARAGAQVYHAGNIGTDGELLTSTLVNAGVRTEFLRVLDMPSGHAVIQVDRSGENAIILFGGANVCVTPEQIDDVLSNFAAGDYLVLQNEINLVGRIMEKASAIGMKIVLNPSPMDDRIKELPLDKVDIFLLNEIEGGQITGESEPDRILDSLQERFSGAQVVLTLGGAGSVYMGGGQRLRQAIYKVDAVDTTAAGDTFTGFFISALLRGLQPAQALDVAARASAIAVSRPGAAPSIPTWDEVQSAAMTV